MRDVGATVGRTGTAFVDFIQLHLAIPFRHSVIIIGSMGPAPLAPLLPMPPAAAATVAATPGLASTALLKQQRRSDIQKLGLVQVIAILLCSCGVKCAAGCGFHHILGVGALLAPASASSTAAYTRNQGNTAHQSR